MSRRLPLLLARCLLAGCGSATGGALFDLGVRYRAERTRTTDPAYPGRQSIETVARYHAGDRTAVREEDDGGVRTAVVLGDPLDGVATATDATDLAIMLDAFDIWREREMPDGRVLVWTDPTDPSRLASDRRLVSLRDARLCLWVAEGGLVRRLALTYGATLNGRPVTVRVERWWTDIGETAVEEPAWLSETAFDRTPTPNEVVAP